MFIKEQDTIGKTQENKKWHSDQEPRIPIQNVMGCSFANTEWHSHCIYDL